MPFRMGRDHSLPPTVDLHMVIEQADDAIGFDDLEGRVVFVNRAFRRMFGLAEGEPLGRLEDYVAPSSIDDVRRRHADRLEGRATSSNYEVEIVRRDGTRLWVEAAVVATVRDGEVVGSCAILRDITVRRERETALRRARRQYRDLFEQAFDAIIIFEPEGEVVLDVNPRACELYGRSREEFIGLSLLSISPRPRAGREALGQLGPGQPIHNLQTVQYHKDGSELVLECNASMIEYQGHKAVLTINRDISERQRMQQRLAHADKMKGIGRLAAGVAHEFNNVLASILGTAEALLDEIDEPGRREQLEQMITRSRAGARITRELLSLSRMPRGPTEAVSPDACVESMLGWLTPLLGDDIELRLEAGTGGAMVLLHGGQLEQLLLNLAINARDVMPEGGTLYVRTTTVELTSVRSTITHRLSAGSYVVIEVRDTGPGIEPASITRIFEPFYTTKGPGAGTGLGLAIIYSIVDRAAGGIEVRNDGGACFTIYLPRAQAEERSPSPARSAAPPAVGPGAGSLLVVDDEVVLAKSLARGLRAVGYEVVTAHDAAAALQIMRERAIDVLVTDHSMPGGDGLELARDARALAPGLKVLVMSGRADRELSTLPEGAEFLAKPFTRVDLLRRLAALLGHEAEDSGARGGLASSGRA